VNDAVDKNTEQPYDGEHVKELESALTSLGAAQAALRGYIDQEHIDAMDRAWEAGNEKLTEVVEAVWPTA
jgi:hypothetical protein